MRVAFVIQRFGDDITGGAESLARQLAKQLTSRLGWEIDVYTSQAKSYQTWANEAKVFEQPLPGLRVKRFPNLFQRSTLFYLYDRLTRPLILKLSRKGWAKHLSYLLESLWFILQGPFCPGLLKDLRKKQGDYQTIFFMTYLYYPVVFGCPEMRSKAVLMPHAHDEGPLYFRMIRRLFQTAPKILTNTVPEKNLIERAVGLSKKQQIDWTGGVGFDHEDYVPQPIEERLKQSPYLLYLGRLSQGKGVHNLIEWFQSAKELLPDGCKLKLAGHLDPDLRIPKDPRIEYLGFVSDEERLELIKNARVVVNLSGHESLSLIVIEAMSFMVPVIVNSLCEVLRYYTEQTDTVLGCQDEASFHKALKLIDQIGPESKGQLTVSRDWALEHFSWDRICRIFQDFTKPMSGTSP